MALSAAYSLTITASTLTSLLRSRRILKPSLISPFLSSSSSSPFKPKVPNQHCRFISSSMASGPQESPENNPGPMASGPKESPEKNPGLCTNPDEATKSYFLQQTMFRIKDPKKSLDFYTRILGMKLLKRLDFQDMKFSLYFLGYEDPSSAPTDPVARTSWTFGRKATIELTHNWGTEKDTNFKGYHNGNSEPRGFGHIGITVDDLHKACARFERESVKFVKKPEDGKLRGLAFIQDPDGYWIEIFDTESIKDATGDAS